MQDVEMITVFKRYSYSRSRLLLSRLLFRNQIIVCSQQTLTVVARREVFNSRLAALKWYLAKRTFDNVVGVSEIALVAW